MTFGYDISLATPDDIPGILAVQEPNLPAKGGSLSVRQTAEWFGNAILEKSIVVGRRNGEVVGYVLGTSLAAHGDRMFAAACDLGVEGIVSKRINAPYRSGPAQSWLKTKTQMRRQQLGRPMARSETPSKLLHLNTKTSYLS